MYNKLLITLIEKDIHELAALTKGFEQMRQYPQVLIDLSVEKAQNLVECLKKLPLELCDEVENEAVVQPVEEQVFEPIIEKQVVETLQEEVSDDIDYEIFNEEQDFFEPIDEPKNDEPIAEQIPEPKNDEPIVEQIPEQEFDYNPIEMQIQLPLEHIIEPKQEAPKVEQISEPQEFTPQIEETKEAPAILNDTLHANENIVFNTLNSKISDIKQAISISDRFRFQRELFEGNGEKLSQALSDFNKMTALQEAQTYIAVKLKWNLQNPVVEDFMELLKRKLD